MAKLTKYFECQNCGAQYKKWQGKCSECNKWNTIEEVDFVQNSTQSSSPSNAPSSIKLVNIQNVKQKDLKRVKTGINEFNRVLGEGFVYGQAVLLAGEPGIGKSTLLLQIAESLKGGVYYICGEESPYQVKQRYSRLGCKSDITMVENTFVETITASLSKHKPKLIIVDSVHSLFSARFKSSAGSISQIKECSQTLIDFAKHNKIPLILVGQVNKQGDIAGPKTLEHMVDTVLFLEGDDNYSFRVLRANKNRYGSINEIGLFIMDKQGMVEVPNPSKYFISSKSKNLVGSAVCLTNEGTRCFAIEIQSLITPMVGNYPKRVSNGFSIGKLNLLSAVIENRLKLKLSFNDIYLNIASGVNLSEPAVDLAVCASLISSKLNKPLSLQNAFFGEVGLNGEVRAVKMTDSRLKEASNMGITSVYSPKNIKSLNDLHSKLFK